MGPRQQWRASERVDNRAADPCRMLDSTTRLPSLCFLSAGPGLSSGSSTALRAYLTVPAWRRSCAPMSVPKVTKASAQLSLCGEGAGGKRGAQWEDGGDNLAHGSLFKACGSGNETEQTRLQNDLIFSPSCVSRSREKNICMSQGGKWTSHIDCNIFATNGRIGIEFGADVHCPHRIHSNVSGDPLVFSSSATSWLRLPILVKCPIVWH